MLREFFRFEKFKKGHNMKEKEVKTVRLSLKINQSMDLYIQTISKERGMSKSAVVCFLLNKCQILGLQ